MFNVYAVEPEALSNWRDIRWVLRDIRPSKGRFIAQLPKDWKKRVYSLAENDNEKKRIEELLASINARAFVRLGIDYDVSKSWRENAQDAYRRELVHGIIVDGQPQSVEICIRQMSGEEGSWHRDTHRLIQYDARSIGRIFHLILVNTQHMYIFDPYFDIADDRKRKVFDALVDSMKGEGNASRKRMVDILVGVNVSINSAVRNARKISDGTLTVRYWKVAQKEQNRVHNRYLLTERWGVAFGDSIRDWTDRAPDSVSILGEESYDKLWKQCSSPSEYFKVLEGPVVI